ncbi:MAG TPA: hypothetical protein VJH63_02955 [Candidatus Paceibacterota bacterium]
MQIIQKIKSFFSNYSEETGICLIIILVAFSSFFLGQFSARSSSANKDKISFEKDFAQSFPLQQSSDKQITTTSSSSTNADEKKEKDLSVPQMNGQNQNGQIVASKNGKRYYFPWCTGISRISEKNKVYFGSALEAERFGLILAANCSPSK